MKVLITAVSIGLIGFFAESFGPWWSGIAVAFLVSALAQLNTWPGFLAGFLGIGIMWGVSAGILNAGNDGILASRIGNMLGGIPGTGILLLTCLLGAILGGLAAYSGGAGMKWIIGK